MIKDRIVFVILLSALLVACATFMSPVLDCNFVTDDYHLLRCVTYGPPEGPTLDPDDPWDVLIYFDTQINERYQLYRPLVAVSIRLSYEISQLNPRGFIWANLILHLLNAIVVALIVRRFLPKSSHAAWGFAVLLFLLHPFQTQVVTWTAARSDSISFFLGSIALLIKIGNPKRQVVPAIFAFLALMTKESAAVWFITLFAIDLIGDKERRQESDAGISIAFRRAIPLFVLGLIYTYMRWNTLGTLGGGTKYMGEDLDVMIAAKGMGYIKDSVQFALAPVSTIVLQDFGFMTLQRGFQAIGSIGLFILGAVSLWKRGPIYLLVALLVMLVPLALIIPLSPLGPDFANTRGFYTPLLAFSLLMAMAISARPKIGIVLSIMLIAGFLPSTWSLQQRWLESAASIQKIADEVKEVSAPLRPEDVDRIVILNYTRPETDKSKFGFAEFPDALMLRPFMHGDFTIEKVTGDLPVAGFDFLVPFSKSLISSTDKTAFVEASFDNEGNANLRVIHLGTSPDSLPMRVTPVSPTPFERREIYADDIDSRTPKFTVRHPVMKEKVRFSIDVLACRGLAVSLPLAPSKVVVKDGMQTTHVTVPPLPLEMIKDLKIPSFFAWSVTVRKKDGTILGRSPMSPFISQLMTR
ncbi:MAG: hypothetical protein ACI97A_002857 [Planctomycetota bacterium]|jgi:hypothetical protein